MSWAEKTFGFRGLYVRGRVDVPDVNEDLLEDCGTPAEALEIAKPVFRMDEDAPVVVQREFKAGQLETIEKELWEVRYKMETLTGEQKAAVDILFKLNSGSPDQGREGWGKDEPADS